MADLSGVPAHRPGFRGACPKGGVVTPSNWADVGAGICRQLSIYCRVDAGGRYDDIDATFGGVVFFEYQRSVDGVEATPNESDAEMADFEQDGAVYGVEPVSGVVPSVV